ncbi:hypothetical protein GQ53DRAFT_768307 [Thozetella sp. PMI_491]|nr:hypothetical protein GQ53DRAFT_768307 [Thozetella sp. PMI_491]
MASTIPEVESWYIAELAIYGVFIIPIFVLWIVLLCSAPRKGDTARVGFSWVKTAYPIWFLALLFQTIGIGLTVFRFELERGTVSYSDYRDTYYHAYEAGIRISLTGIFLAVVAQAILLIAYVELGNGILYCLTGVQSTLQKVLRFAAIGAATLVVVVQLAWYGTLMSAWTPYFSYVFNDASEDYYDIEYDAMIDTWQARLKTAYQIGTAVDVLHWVFVLATIAYAAFVVHKAKNNRFLIYSAVMVLVATILDFLSSTWNIAYDATWLLPDKNEPFYTLILFPVLGSITVSVALILLFAAAVRRSVGIRSNQQQAWPSNGAQTGGYPQVQVVNPQQQWGQAYPQQQYQQQYQQQPVQYQQYPQQYPVQNGHAPQQYPSPPPVPEQK